MASLRDIMSTIKFYRHCCLRSRHSVLHLSFNGVRYTSKVTVVIRSSVVQTGVKDVRVAQMVSDTVD